MILFALVLRNWTYFLNTI